MSQTNSKQKNENAEDTGSASEEGAVEAGERQEDQVVRFQSEALDALSTPVMMADNNFVIYYANKAAVELVRDAANGLSEVWAGLDRNNLIGQSINKLYTDSSQANAVLGERSLAAYQAGVKVAGGTFDLTVTLTGDDPDEFGYTIAWERNTRDIAAKMASVERGQASIEFDLDGNVLWCNDNFLAATGYRFDEIEGRHHRMFCDPAYAASAEYAQFWDRLASGESFDGEFERVNKAGEVLWLRASYNPVLGDDGQPVKFFKIASDITESKLRSWDLESKMQSVERGQASIEFDLDGNVLWCNDNFLAATGYRFEEIEGRHHRMFCDDQYASSPEYSRFWDDLRRGQSFDGEFKRVNKAGEVLWLRASYNPVLGDDGQPVKFFKIASDITESKLRSWDLESKMQSVERGQASIEFDLDGNVLWCNDNFLAATGYRFEEIEGRHHRMFCDDQYASSPEYSRFWDDLRRGQSFDGEFKRVNKAGEVLWLRASYNPVLGDDGQPVKFFKIASDITESKLRSWDLESKMQSVERGQASIEFDLDGNVLWCNDNFLAATGYRFEEIEGRHHRMFCDDQYASSPEYSRFWDDLRRGQSFDGEFKRVNKAGEVLWLRASYNPVLGDDGQPVKFFKIASDITESKLRSWDLESKMQSVERGQASIEFDLDGNVLWCNDNFLAATGYRFDEIEGRHHRMFCDASYASSAEYMQFWDNLRQGQSFEGEFKRVNKAGEVLWLRASYNPVIGDDGKPVKFFKIASDITESKLRSRDLEAKMSAVDRGQASIEFDLEGNVLSCNDNFLATMGYSIEEIRGRHHRMFVESAAAADRAYTEFWDTLKRGQSVEGEFRRVNKAGELIWLRASYNPVIGDDGKPTKFFKIASEITEEKQFRDQIESIVGRTSEVMTAVSQGDLTQTIDGDYEGTLRPLQQATNSSIENLSSLVSQIRDSTSSMSTSAQEVALANTDLSRRTESQASSLEETAASMEQMTGTVDQNADNARKASQLAVGAREQAEGGGDVVDRAVQAMGAISESSKKIADIIGVIDEIAFQTNLLALNAAVEAARAGDQGRGFAVVASEVRNLAQRSAGAAKEIKALIQDSLDKVDDGSKLVNQSGSQLEEIVNSVKKVSDIIGEIAAASEEQSSGINQVNQAIADMDQGTQQNAAMVEEAAAASESMQQQASALQTLTDRFQIESSMGGLGVPAPAAMPAPAMAPAQPAPVAEPVAAATEAFAPSPEFAGDDQAWQEF